jgi:biopolymer transport protein ExbD
LIYFKPYSPRDRKRNKVTSINFSKFKSHRRVRLNHLIGLTSFIWFFWFLNFAARLGPIPWFVSANFHTFQIAQQSQGIRIPITQSHKPFGTSARHLMNVSLNRAGKIIINGTKVEYENLKNIFSYVRANDPIVKPFLIIDKECKMEYVNKVIAEIKSARIRKIYFCTNDYSYKM